ncbi:hypothetical protein ACQ4LE_005178 [Meloidogyne hapla]
MEVANERIKRNRALAIERRLTCHARDVLNEIIDVIEATEDKTSRTTELTISQIVRIKRKRREAIEKARLAAKRRCDK